MPESHNIVNHQSLFGLVSADWFVNIHHLRVKREMKSLIRYKYLKEYAESGSESIFAPIIKLEVRHLYSGFQNCEKLPEIF